MSESKEPQARTRMSNFEDQSFVAVRPEERGFAASAHLMAAIPLWGLVFLGLLWIFFKERSREVVFHVQQAMIFQMTFLAVAVFALTVYLIALPVGVLHEGLANFISHINTFFLISVYTLFAGTCLVGVGMVMTGRVFLYPVIGRRILEGTQSKLEEA